MSDPADEQPLHKVKNPADEQPIPSLQKIKIPLRRDERLDPYRGRIAAALLCLLFFAMVLDVALTFWASYDIADAAKNVASVFNIWVPVISSLAGSAVTWYFTGQR